MKLGVIFPWEARTALNWQHHLQDFWPTIATLLTLALSLFCSGHAVLHKRDSRAATGWVGIIWLVPIIGACLYLLLGINRIRRFGKVIRKKFPDLEVSNDQFISQKGELAQRFPAMPQLTPLARLSANVTMRPLLMGNRITPLIDGDEAFPKMLKAIEKAQRSITLSTYIFDNDQVGKRFMRALADAVDRGVEVRVLIDDIGLRYSWRPVLRSLRRLKITVAPFMKALRPMTLPHINLRKHRKILVVDGLKAFTGGMNIREGHQLSLQPKHPVKDMHFELEGPVVTQLQEVFIKDWAFTTKKILQGPLWFAEQSSQGNTLSRVIVDGPDDDLDRLPMIIEGAISAAINSIWIVTPYFLPHASLAGTLSVAASKGVAVNIILPTTNNLPFVQWASNPQLLPLLKNGCHIWFSKPPFDHSKLILVDGVWSLFGSANLDPRSLRLNFELCVESYDEVLGERLRVIIAQKLQGARKLSLADLKFRPLPLRLRDGVARLFSPYL